MTRQFLTQLPSVGTFTVAGPSRVHTGFLPASRPILGPELQRVEDRSEIRQPNALSVRHSGVVAATSDEQFVAFVRARGRALARSATLITGNPVAGEDLLQTALAQTYARWRIKPDIDELERYVRVVLVRAHLTWQRRKSSDELPAELGLGLSSGGEVTHDVAPDIAERFVDRAVLLAALQRLAPKQRAALVLRFFDDLSEADTAQALGCSTGSVKQHTTRGLAKLRLLLGSEVALAP